MKLFLKGVLISGLILFWGCGVSPKASLYLLGGPERMMPEQSVVANLSLGIGPVVMPGYLDRIEILIRTGGNGIHVEEYHRWASPLDGQLRELLMINLSALLDTPRVVLFPWERSRRPEYRVDVTVLRFEQTEAGAVLDALWYITDVDKDQILDTQKFSDTIPVEGMVASYVKAQSRAVEALSRGIAKGIIKITQPGDGELMIKP